MKFPSLALGLLILVTSTTTLSAQNANDAPYRASELVQRWDVIVNETFESLKAFSSDEFVDEVMDLVDEFLSIGAVRAVQDHATDPQLRRADDAVKRLATTMVEEGDRHSDGSTQVTEMSFQAGRKKICPVYPFCQ
jgi:hypothetical protein